MCRQSNAWPRRPRTTTHTAPMTIDLRKALPLLIAGGLALWAMSAISSLAHGLAQGGAL